MTLSTCSTCGRKIGKDGRCPKGHGDPLPYKDPKRWPWSK